LAINNVTCSLSPTNGTTFIRGGTVRFLARVTNNTPDPLNFYAGTKVQLPNGTLSPSPGYGPPYLIGSTINIGANSLISQNLSYKISNDAQFGTYTYHGAIGPLPLHPSTMYDHCTFNFTVVQ
jgi:hypothetical protein